jgi:hypothetical protein
MEFLGDGSTAEDRTTLENAYGEAGFGEVAGAGESVVAAPDDDGVEAGGGA